MAKKKVKRQAPQAARKSSEKQAFIIGAVIIVIVAVFLIGSAIMGSKNAANVTDQPDPASGIPAPSTKQWSSPPEMGIDVTKQYFAHIEMEKGGTIVIQLFPDKAPVTVNNFIFLATEGFFNGSTFHRVLSGFMAQGGDPTGTGAGGPGYEFANEDNDLSFDKPGVVAMANAGRDTNGSQFFITFAAANWLDGGYTIFGQVVEGMDVVNRITLRDPQTNPQFRGDAIISVTITEK